jgi:hypothetical protein
MCLQQYKTTGFTPYSLSSSGEMKWSPEDPGEDIYSLLSWNNLFVLDFRLKR